MPLHPRRCAVPLAGFNAGGPPSLQACNVHNAAGRASRHAYAAWEKKGGKREAGDARMSRYACYMLFQNAGPAEAQQIESMNGAWMHRMPIFYTDRGSCESRAAGLLIAVQTLSSSSASSSALCF